VPPSGTCKLVVIAVGVCFSVTGIVPSLLGTVALIHSKDDGCGTKSKRFQPGSVGLTPSKSLMMTEFGPLHQG
jgi:hypothetical protein